MDWLWPIKTGKTFFDYWSLIHFFFWAVVGSTFAHTAMGRTKVFGICMALAYLWEFMERYLEVKYPNVFLTPESWVNSYVSDPLMCVIGLLVAWYGFDNWRP
jgi:hypothetical protein